MDDQPLGAEYNYELRDDAIKTLYENYKSNFKKGTHFEMHFKSLKGIKKESISVLRKLWNKPNNFYSHIFNPQLLRCEQRLPEKIMYTSKLVKIHNRI